MKRLLCLVSGMNAGGAETFLMKLYRKLNRNLYQMDFGVYTKEECFYDREIESLGGKIYHITPKTEDFKGFKQELYNLIKEKNFVYVLRITSNAAGFLDLKIAHEAGARVCIARSSNSNDENAIKVRVIHLVSRFLYGRYVDVKMAPSDLAGEYTFGRKAVKLGDVHFFHNALDLNVYKFSEKGRSEIRREFNMDDNLVIGHIGRFSEQKNHKFLIEVFCELLKLKLNAILLLVGEGELEYDIKKMTENFNITDKVIFAGVRSDIPSILSAMDVFAFPSFYEGMPNTVIEAQSTGLPCVISDKITKQADITGLVEYLPIEEPKIWVESILNAVKKIRKITREAFIEKGYDITRTVREFERLVFEERKL